MRPRQLFYPPNPDYGTGACRRIIGIASRPGTVDAHLSDNFHEMRCRIRHDGRIVTAIESEAIRIPTSACPGAASILQELVGIRLDTPKRALYADGRALRHCTHLFDLAVLAIGFAPSPPMRTRFEAIVPDELDAPVFLSIRQDGRIVHRWLVRDGVIQEPESLRGNILGKGFAHWASTAFAGSTLDAATILARTWLIAIGRQFLTTATAGQPIAVNRDMAGRCFAYSPPHAATAVFLPGHLRSETDL